MIADKSVFPINLKVASFHAEFTTIVGILANEYVKYEQVHLQNPRDTLQ
jgi:hypothetical protein